MDDLKLKKIACSTIDDNSETLFELSYDIWKHPELQYEEFYAHQILSDFLEKRGFAVTRSYLLETAFKAEFGTDDGPNIAILCEYDALPGLGHACGHNLIAEVGIAAGIAVMNVLKHLKDNCDYRGKVTILGCPAEEGGGGKMQLIEGGAFKACDAAMMAHPFNATIKKPLYLALKFLRVEFHGKAAHSSDCPWGGINALDAAVAAYESVSNLRQQFKPTYRVHGIISKGGVKPNIIPDHTQLLYYVRAPTAAEVDVLYDQVVACCQAAAIATGCTMDHYEDHEFHKDVVSNDTMCKLLEKNSAEWDLLFHEEEIPRQYGGSTDMGSVTYELPSIHPQFYIAPPPLHTNEFQKAAGLPDAQINTLKVAKCLALVALDLLTDPRALAETKVDFAKDVKSGEVS